MFYFRSDSPVLIDEQAMDLSSFQSGFLAAAANATAGGDVPTDNDLSYSHLSFLTLQAVTQTVLICLAGFIVAKAKILTPDVQKHISTLNVQLLTPALIFTKLASSLSLSALIDIAIIPVLFVITTGISFSCAKLMSRIMRFNLSESNFVTAMAVFGNSNSLPVSLTVSLAYTLPNLMWPDLEKDSQDDVASRGILYLLIFQQLGQIVRWSWGYNTLMTWPKNTKAQIIDYDVESRPGVPGLGEQDHANDTQVIIGQRRSADNEEDNEDDQAKLLTSRVTTHVNSQAASSSSSVVTLTLPEKSMIEKIWIRAKRYYHAFIAFMNPPLWSMFISIFIASVPAFQKEIFESHGFVQNTFTRAIQQVAGMAIPMILLVLGANLAPNDQSAPASPRYKSIVFTSLLCRMVLPAFFLLPIIALSVKYLKISILDDPIFLVVAFVLTVSPPAIQLSQICQLNEFYEKEMAGVLFWGYVILTLPSTIIIVVSSLEVLEWAGTTVS